MVKEGKGGSSLVGLGAEWCEFDDERSTVGVGISSGGVKVGVGESNKIRFLLPGGGGADGRSERAVLEVDKDGFYIDGEPVAGGEAGGERSEEDEHWGVGAHGVHDLNVYGALCEFLDGCGDVEDLVFVLVGDAGEELEKLRITPDGFYVDGRELDGGGLLPDHLHAVYWKLMGVMARGRQKLQDRVRELERMLDL
jgi:hypothetical protein